MKKENEKINSLICMQFSHHHVAARNLTFKPYSNPPRSTGVPHELMNLHIILYTI